MERRKYKEKDKRALIRWLHAQIKSAGITDRNDRLELARQLIKQGLGYYPGIDSFNDLERHEVEYLIESLRSWELVQEVRMYLGDLELDNEVAKLAKQYSEIKEQ